MKPLLALLAAALTLLAAPAQNAPSLKDVGDIGKVIDCQGISSIRPTAGTRWTYPNKGMPLKPGDWLRTDVRGANALQVRLEGGSGLILGPGTLIEVAEPGKITLVRGELEVAPGKDRQVIVMPGEGKSLAARETRVFRHTEGKRGLQLLEKDPNWLKGFKGAVVHESMGQLVAKVDGRDTPLTIGYHKVNVDIRDQIARTTIEESFVNHTKSRLEGVFYFPLPQDASISGFGMWINGELVEADVVEKQRAREIYETILREKRDPGLLEWTGGNLFKARVFPIFGHSEKRIKITYTQVLPYRNGSYRYSYALQSEMLRANPLRELAVNVRVHSAIPITKFTCPTHAARINTTANSAQAEFTAQEYTPSRDFEIEIEVDNKASPVTVIPHRRGEDGYFLALVTPPDDAAAWQRDLVADGEPIELIILADTSGSMDDTARANQDALIAALLGSLGEKDSFQIATCDTAVHWFDEIEKFTGAGGELAGLMRRFVAARSSLGWSDLDKTFASVMNRLKDGKNTHVVYIGDGVITTSNADPVAFANRLQQLYKGHSATFHAVAPSSSFESGVLNTIASLGGGSVRKIEGSDTPGAVANQLLAEISSPGLRDLQIEFSGLRTARVYPGRLPNLAAGRQQICIGRYLPEGEDQTGEIVVTGTRDGKKLTFRSPVVLRDAESGNSFIPRLWARMHLDALLAQGRSPEVRDEVIALSEEYHIMTPYTSFLVLESDADRERFKVKRRFLMRDGERFFADGRDQANYELLQKQMRIAGTWRLNLRRGYINQLRTIGRHPNIFPQARPAPGNMKMPYGFSGGNDYAPVSPELWHNEIRSYTETAFQPGWGQSTKETLNYAPGKDGGESSGFDDAADWNEPFPAAELPPTDPFAPPGDPSVKLAESERLQSFEEESYERKQGAFRPMSQLGPRANSPADQMMGDLRTRQPYDKGRRADAQYMVGYFNNDLAKNFNGGKLNAQQGWHWSHYMQDLPSLFPSFNARRSSPPLGDDHPWPKEAREIAKRLLRSGKLAALENGGIEIDAAIKQHDPRWDRVSGSWESRRLITRDAWLATTKSDRADAIVNWCTAEERGVLGRAFELGRLRKPIEGEGKLFPAVLNNASITSLAHSYKHYQVEVQKRDKNRVLLVLTFENAGHKTEAKFLIDTERDVLMRREGFYDDKLTSREVFSDWVKAGGVWWPTRARTTNADGKLTSAVELSVRALDDKAFDAAFAKELLGRKQTLFLNEPLPDVEAAKQAGIDNKRNFESELVLLQHFALSQQWERAGEHFDRLKKFAAAQPGFRWLDMRFQAMQRRNEEVKQAVLAAAKELAAAAREGEYALASHLRSQANNAMQANELHELLEILKPVYGRTPKHTFAQKEWDYAWLWSLQSIGRRDEALIVAKANAETYGWEMNSQTQYANLLSNSGNLPAAQKWLEQQIAVPHWNEDERSSLRQQFANYLENGRELERVKAFVEAWLEQEPETKYAWPHQRYASVLIRLDEVERAYELVGKWLKAATEAEGDELSAGDKARLDAALNVLFGQSYGVHRDRIEARFHEPLAKVVRKFARSEKRFGPAQRIMSDYRFHQTDQVQKLRAEFAKLLVKRSGNLPFADLQRIIPWLLPNVPAVEVATWEQIAGPIIERWSALEEIPQRDQWASLIATVLARVGGDSYTDFLRRQLRESPEDHHGRYALIILNHLMALTWSEEHEAEAFQLLYAIAPGVRTEDNKAETHVLFRAGALMKLNDWVTNFGYSVLYAAVEKKEDLSRTDLAAISREKRDEIRNHLAARLADELANREGLDEGFSHWLNIERLYFDIGNKRDPGEVAAECWEFLGNFDPLAEDGKRTWGEAMLITRYLDTLEYLAARPKADAALVDRVLALQTKGIKAQPDTQAWKQRQYRLLVALDRAGTLKDALRSWIRPAEADSQWRVTLGYVLAELNDLDAAIAEFEAVEKADELRPREYRVLADWYLVRDAKGKRERALLGYYNAMPDHQISNLISQRTQQVRMGFETGVPEDLDPEVPVMFTALLRKSPHPQNHLYQLAELYRYTKDFRLLECIPEGVIGHTALQIYPFLQGMASVHNHIRDEATTDMIFAHLEKVRARATTKIDGRGLDLLEMLVRRKASEVLNQPGQHLPMALAAMRRAFDGDWEDGERYQMAVFLNALGNISQDILSAEQLREMAALHRDEKADADRMSIGHLHGQLLWQYNRYDESINVLEFVLRDAEETGGGALPQSAQTVLDTFLSYLTHRKRYTRAEQEIFRVLGQDIVASLRHWTYSRKFRLYNETLSGGGTVSIGTGETLYRNAERLIVAALPEVDHRLRQEIVGTLVSIYRTAHHRKIGDAPADARRFAYGAFDELVPFETQNYQSLVSRVASCLRRLIGYRESLAFLIGRYEKEPASFRATNQEAWRSYGNMMADHRHHCKGALGTLEPRLLKIVLAELRRELVSRQSISNSIYWRWGNSHFWTEKADDFARMAEAVLKQKRKSVPTVIYIARYFHDGLHLQDRGINILIDLYDRELLDENSWSTLVGYLESGKRWKEVVQYLVPLIEFRPDNLSYRVRLMSAYYHNSQRDKLVATLDAIDQRWHDKKWWNESTLATVAAACHNTTLWQHAVDYYDELIPLHQRTHQARGIGNGTLSNYYATLAACHQNLDNTPAAVEAAAGAIVSWGTNISSRKTAVQTLLNVLRASKNLDGYVAVLEKQVAETGLENPIVRKALGQVYLDVKDPKNAIPHLTLAVENQPNDEDTHLMLVNAYAAMKDDEGAIRALLEATKLSRRNIALYQDLGRRYEKLGRADEAERARTNIIEALPNESEGHALLAKIRQEQDRWEEAAAHWQQVATLRELEPTGLQRLADAQIKLDRRAAAAESLQKLLAKEWPSRFGKVHSEARDKLAKLEKKAG